MAHGNSSLSLYLIRNPIRNPPTSAVETEATVSSQNQVAFNEDQAELEAHFTERVQAYLELGETPEEALLSAQEKFGETERVLSELRWQRLRRSPILWGLICAGGYLLLVTFVKASWTYWTLYLYYQLYVWQTTPMKKHRASG